EQDTHASTPVIRRPSPAGGGRSGSLQGAYSVVVATCRGLGHRRALRVVHVDPDAAAVVHHLDPVDAAAVVGHALRAQHLAAGAALDAADAVGQRLVATVAATLLAGRGRQRRHPGRGPAARAPVVLLTVR